VKVLKILGVVFGALLLLTGIGLMAGSAVVGAGQGKFDEELAKQGLAGPVQGKVTAVDQSTTLYTVKYTDKQGAAQTGTGPVASGTKAPAVGNEVEVYYNLSDPSQIVILDNPAVNNLGGVGKTLRTIGIVCLILGAVLLLAGIIGLVRGRKARAAVAGDQPGVPQPVGVGGPPPAQGGGEFAPGQQQALPDPANEQLPPSQQYPPTA
jgi:Protein of unknown function (DUF3592)